MSSEWTVEDVLAVIGEPVTVSWAQGDPPEASYANLTGTDGSVLIWCRPIARFAARPPLSELATVVELRGRPGGGPMRHTRLVSRAAQAIVELVDRRLRLVRFGRGGLRALGSWIVWTDGGRQHRLVVTDEPVLAIETWSDLGWVATARFALTAAEAGVLRELLDLVDWLALQAVQDRAAAWLADRLLDAIRTVAGGRADLRQIAAALRRQLGELLDRAPLRADAPAETVTLGALLIAWHGVHALAPDLDADELIRWIADERPDGVRDVTAAGPATRTAVRALPVRWRTRRRLLRQMRRLRRAGLDPTLVTTGRRWKVVSRRELVRPAGPLPRLDWLDG